MGKRFFHFAFRKFFMTKKMTSILLFAFIAAISLLSMGCGGSKSDKLKAKKVEKKKVENPKVAELVMGVFPRRPAKVTNKAFTPLAKYLESKIGMKVKLVISKDFAAYEKKLNSGVFDLVHLNHFQYVKVRKSLGYDVIVMNEEFGTSKLKSAIFVKKDSKFKTLKDLKGKKIIFGGGKTAFIAYMGTTKLLREAGLKSGDYIEEFAKNPPNALIALARGQSDGTGTGHIGHMIPMIKKTGDDKKVRILAASDPYPHLPWAVKKSMKDELKAKIKKAFLALNDTEEGKKILKAARVTGFAEANDGLYDVVPQVVKAIQDK